MTFSRLILDPLLPHIFLKFVKKIDYISNNEQGKFLICMLSKAFKANSCSKIGLMPFKNRQKHKKKMSCNTLANSSFPMWHSVSPPSPRTRASLITIMVPYRILEEFTLLTASKIISSKMQCNLANACLNGMWQLGLIFMLFTATLFRSNVKKPFFLREEVNLLSSCVIMIVIALI